MLVRNVEILDDDRADELLTIINMIGYAIAVAGNIGVQEGLSDLKAARSKLVAELQQIGFPDLSPDELSRLARVPAGHC